MPEYHQSTINHYPNDRRNRDRRQQIVISEGDLEKFTDKLVERVREKHNDFDLDPEQHYKEHIELNKFLKSMGEARSIFMKAFLSLIFVGMILIAGASEWLKK